MTVLDASAVLALIHNEPGSDLVARELAGASLCAANLAEVVGKLVDADIDVARLRQLLDAAGITTEPLIEVVLAELPYVTLLLRVRGNTEIERKYLPVGASSIPGWRRWSRPQSMPWRSAMPSSAWPQEGLRNQRSGRQ
jgi:hypothetical protein